MIGIAKLSFTVVGSIIAAQVACLAIEARADAIQPDTVNYRIRPNDTLSELSGRALAGPKALRAVERLNKIVNPNRIAAGQLLKLPRPYLRDELSVAKISALSGEVMVRSGYRSGTASVGAQLMEGASIDTGRNAFLTLQLSDGSTISIPSQSMVQIRRLRRVILTSAVEREFAIVDGHVRAKVTPMRDARSTFRVTTPITVSAVRGTEFRIDYDAGSELAVTQVEVGKVATTSGSGKTDLLVTSGFGVAAGKNSATALIRLIAAPELKNPGDVQSGRELFFALNAEAGASAYRIQIARDAGILDIVEEDRSALPEFALPSVASGTYFVRLAAIDGSSVEGFPRIVAFDRFRNSVGGAMTTQGSGIDHHYLFKWQSDTDGTPRFRFQLYRGTVKSVPVVDEIALSDAKLDVTNLPGGEYFWHVQSAVNFEGKILENWSSFQNFTVTLKK